MYDGEGRGVTCPAPHLALRATQYAGALRVRHNVIISNPRLSRLRPHGFDTMY